MPLPGAPSLWESAQFVQVAMQDAGAGTPANGESIPSQKPTAVSFFVATYNDLIKYVHDHCHYFEMPTT